MRHPWIVVIFAAAMGILEAAVVVYLRHIYYPTGFGFPLTPMERSILQVELVREAMTIVMLVCVAMIAAERTWARLMAFLVAFGTWDILYYVGLKIWLGWPASVFEPDILFLIPKPWVGPVLAPVLVSVLWIAAGLSLHRANVQMRVIELAGALLGAGLIFASFVLPGGAGAAESRGAGHGSAASDPHYYWPLFCAGYLIGLVTLVIIARRTRAA